MVNVDLSKALSQEFFINQYNRYLFNEQMGTCFDSFDFVTNTIYQNLELCGLNFERMSFINVCFINCTFYNCIFSSFIFHNCEFLGNTIFNNCTFRYTDFRDIKSLGNLTIFEGCTFKEHTVFTKNDFSSYLFINNCFSNIDINSSFNDAFFIDNDLADNCIINPKVDIRGIKITCPEKGSFIAYKKAVTSEQNNIVPVIVELLIPEDAKRSSSNSRKCRCDKAKVLSITALENDTIKFDTAKSMHDSNFIYRVGQEVSVNDFDDNRWNECAPGIHFFITRQEAVNY